MDKIKEKYLNKKTLKINEKNNIDSIIEIFQRFGKKYNIITTTLDPNIQYETKDIKITQTYTSTILKTDINKMIKKLKKYDRIALVIIENSKKNITIENKIRKLRKLENTDIKQIKEKETFNTLDKIIREA